MMANKKGLMALIAYCTLFLMLYLLERHGQHLGLTVDAAIHLNSNVDDCASLGSKQNPLTCLGFIPTTDGVNYCEVGSNTDPANPCDFQPCKYGGVCVPAVDMKNYTCKCQYPASGPKCNELACENCFRDKDYVIFVNLTRSTFPVAYEYCVSRGLMMFMDKDWSRHGFIFGIMNTLIPNRDAHVAFWLGMNRTSSSDPWIFVDGTPLSALPNNYSNWVPSRPLGDLCVGMPNTEFYLYGWDDEVCDTNTGWNYYPVCEMTYPFFLL